MTKYYFKPIKEVVLETYRKHTDRDLDAPDDLAERAILIIEADSEEEAKKIRIGFTDITMWEKIDEE